MRCDSLHRGGKCECSNRCAFFHLDRFLGATFDGSANSFSQHDRRARRGIPVCPKAIRTCAAPPPAALIYRSAAINSGSGLSVISRSGYRIPRFCVATSSPPAQSFSSSTPGSRDRTARIRGGTSHSRRAQPTARRPFFLTAKPRGPDAFAINRPLAARRICAQAEPSRPRRHCAPPLMRRSGVGRSRTQDVTGVSRGRGKHGHDRRNSNASNFPASRRSVHAIGEVCEGPPAIAK